MNQEIDYLDELMRLVKHQNQHDYVVRYSFQIVSGDDQHLLIVHALKEQSPDDESPDPILKHPNTDPLLLWSEHNYVKIVKGGIVEGHGIFQLTPLARELG